MIYELYSENDPTIYYNNSVHQSVCLDKGAFIGRDNKIWHFTHIQSGAKIGYRNSIGQNCYIAGVIGAVAPEYRKMGVFKEINIESLYLAKRLGITRVENNVLVTNYPVMKTYTSLKYTIIRSELTLHYWNG